jgi:prepilin-type N-terminal cleavage/methylation domain-containing protein
MKAIRPTKRSEGVTLLELLAVLLIAGLLAAIGIPSFNAILKGTALRNAATALTDTLALARQLAIANRYMYRVEFITDEGKLPASERAAGVTVDSYRIYFVERKAKDYNNPKEDEKITVGKWRLLPRFVIFDPKDLPPTDPNRGRGEIIFKPTGGAFARPGSGIPFFQLLHTVSGTKGEEKAMEIAVNPITGTARSKPVLASP